MTVSCFTPCAKWNRKQITQIFFDPIYFELPGVSARTLKDTNTNTSTSTTTTTNNNNNNNGGNKISKNTITPQMVFLSAIWKNLYITKGPVVVGKQYCLQKHPQGTTTA